MFARMLITAFFLFAPCVHSAAHLQDMEGRFIPVSSLKGKWVYINFWASWCQPCIDEIPHMNRFYQQNKNNNLVLFGVNFDALAVKEQKELIEKLGIHYPSLQEDPSSVLKLGDVRGVPVTFVFNPQGQLRHTLYGAQTINSLSRAMNNN